MVYVSDMLREIAESTGAWVGRQYRNLPRWVDTIEEREEDNRTAEEIAADVIRRAGLTVIHAEEDSEENNDGCI